MPRKVWIKVKGTQASVPGENNEEIELITEGTYARRNGTHCLTYDESEATGMAGTKTTIRVNGSAVYINRTGSINSQLMFETGKTYSARYDTTYGFISMNTHTDKIKVDINERSGGDISVEYRVEMDGSHSFENKFKIAFNFGTPTGKLLSAIN
jgi:uncharacterized beta-barrel protein YwiB (DUF1934 family)